jgi:hypothetical protein
VELVTDGEARLKVGEPDFHELEPARRVAASGRPSATSGVIAIGTLRPYTSGVLAPLPECVIRVIRTSTTQLALETPEWISKSWTDLVDLVRISPGMTWTTAK